MQSHQLRNNAGSTRASGQVVVRVLSPLVEPAIDLLRQAWRHGGRRWITPWRAGPSDWLRRELDTQRTRHLHDRFKAGLCTRRAGLVEAFAAQAGVLGYLRHALGPRHIAEREHKLVWIVGLK